MQMKLSASATLFALLLSAWLSACQTETAASVLVRNDYPETSDAAERVTVYKAWYSPTLFRDPIAPGASSDAERAVPTTDEAYALLAVGWDPESAGAPVVLMPAKSKTRLSIERGATLTIGVSDATFDGNCAAGRPLSQEDADFIITRVFPGDFATATYDAKSCKAQVAQDGGDRADAGSTSDGPPAVDAAAE
jgi:hypothetical protein